ncbi:MAG: DNA repair exonuclease [Alicyclobacillus sp.]|nr:DNA repair exonuclease [Alicyclobacillus sp.]
MFKFVHCADIHLDSPLRGLSALADAPADEIRGATRRALENLVDLCIREAVQFLVIAGDVYDGDWDDYNTALFFHRCMSRLQSAGIPVYLIRGNHDAASHMSRRLTLPTNVVEFPSDAPHTERIPALNVSIHGQSFAHRAVTDNLARNYPEPDPGHFNIGILHTCAEGQEGHEPYAPCTVAELAAKGYQYWALGHIHQRQVLHENPCIVFPGNIQGRHIREPGEKGCTLVTVDGASVRLEHRNLDVLRFFPCEVDLGGVTSEIECTQRIERALADLAEAHDCLLAVRVTLCGATSLHGDLVADQERFDAEVRAAAQNVAGERLWVERVRFRTEMPQSAAEAVQSSLVGLLESMEEASADETFVSAFLSDMQSLQSRMRDYQQTPDALVLEDEEDVRGLFADARALLLTRLQGGGVGR